ncbi:hypothetical protein DFH09DRAFT_940149, partial [Mycena vulgaris]
VGPVGDIFVANASVTLDGTTRPAVHSGGQFPDTMIVGNKGDRFQLNCKFLFGSPQIIELFGVPG